MKKTLLSGLVLLGLFTNAQETKKANDSIQKLDEVLINANTIFGSKYVARNRTGSSYYVSPEELKRFNYTNINRVLNSVPGVNFYEEDGFGLRPNISLRGTSPERSAKISIMEDGVLIAPAPYSSPSAYYFPSVARMQAVEILKGSSQVQYGPFTTGGAINFVSAQVPKTFNGEVRAQYGSFDTAQLLARIGDTKGQFGYVVEFLNYNSNGFKNLPDDSNTGFDRNEVLAKVGFKSKAEAKTPQSLELKFQYSDEVSNETYLGLTEADFALSPFSRYASSQEDQMVADHLQFMLTHNIDFTPSMRLTTTAYNNNFKRNWYKLDDVTFNDDKQGIANVISNPEAFPNHLAILRGDVNTGANDALLVKANNREYLAQGIQTKFDYHWSGDNVFHDLEIGARYHYDEEDRFQWEDEYSLIDGEMAKTLDGPRGAQGNRISSAKAFSAYTLYKIKFNNWTFTPGLRYESVKLERENFGDNFQRDPAGEVSVRENNIDILIPGVGFNYKFSDGASVFGGVHKGFSPPSNQPGQNAEESINYEIGTRFMIGQLRGEVVAYYNDYSNLLGSDLAATGGTGSLEQFNAGEVAVKGLEVLFNYELLPNSQKFKLPITFGYTLTDTEFLNSFGSNDDLWGEVTAGDELPYIAKHQFNTAISLEHQKFSLNLNGRYNGEFRTLAGSGEIADDERVDSNFIVDFSGKYHISKSWSLTGRVINLFDETYAVSRVPAGLRPGHPFGASAGFEFRF